MLTIRFSRIGKKKQPMYRLIISEKSKDPYGKSLEILGSYNPFTKDLVIKQDRIEYWLSQGSQMSESVNNLFVDKGIVKGKKKTTIHISKKRRVKLDEKKKKNEEAVKVAQEKASAPASEAA